MMNWVRKLRHALANTAAAQTTAADPCETSHKNVSQQEAEDGAVDGTRDERRVASYLLLVHPGAALATTTRETRHVPIHLLQVHPAERAPAGLRDDSVN